MAGGFVDKLKNGILSHDVGIDLGTANILAASEMLHMGGADIGHNGNIRLGNARQVFDFAKTAHTHFKHCDLTLLARRHKRHGHTDHTVEIALGKVGVEFAFEY